ncbi:alpha/beta fold hydrolase [Hyalangium minutum]|uniref:Hydrolase, alpha/beta fold family protein n=1 Tax=Hyalangium minutum TaxID=394096 RepID=A0A085W473_9BACT|nr:alpha/beta hydrolase [Hyalangium minutum]KFE62486.1 hydrolase, alpha/beta fold family protein [Hyalangium minutum]
MTERWIESRGIRLCTESFGSPDDPPILLIMGAMSSMKWWPDGLVAMLVAAGRFVVRYDQRDMGRSTTYPPGAPGYTVDDLADDVIAVLDGYGLARAHLVGMSLGGMLSQIVALKAPERVLSLTLISAEFLGDLGFTPPPLSPALLAHFGTAATLDWSDEAAVLEFMVKAGRLNSSGRRPYDEALARRVAAAEFRRSHNLQSMMNYTVLTGGERWYGRTHELQAPLLIIHGALDPVVAYAHGIALSRAVPGAKLVTLEDAGHELHETDWPTIANAITAHTGAAH